MDAFYASVEQRDHPEYKGKPVAVGYAGPRGVVAAASYEARKFGVRSAMASATALRKCPSLVFLPTRFDVYKSVSKQIHEIFSDYTSLIEPLSLDEAYLDVTENIKGLKSATATAEEIRQRIFETTRLTASAGISYNKFLAKLASDIKKPNGQFTILPSQGKEFIEKLKIEKFYGIGPVTAKKMKDLNIHNGSDLKKQSLLFLKTHFGKTGEWYYAIARGNDNRNVEPDRPRKSYSSENTFATDLFNEADATKEALKLMDEVWAWSERAETFGRTVTLKFKFSDFKQITRSRSLTVLIDSREELEKLVTELIHTIFPIELGLRLIGVGLSNFDHIEEDVSGQLSLLE
jgi:DNA polymerase-4